MRLFLLLRPFLKRCAAPSIRHFPNYYIALSTISQFSNTQARGLRQTARFTKKQKQKPLNSFTKTTNNNNSSGSFELCFLFLMISVMNNHGSQNKEQNDEASSIANDEGQSSFNIDWSFLKTVKQWLWLLEGHSHLIADQRRHQPLPESLLSCITGRKQVQHTRSKVQPPRRSSDLLTFETNPTIWSLVLTSGQKNTNLSLDRLISVQRHLPGFFQTSSHKKHSHLMARFYHLPYFSRPLARKAQPSHRVFGPSSLNNITNF